MLCFETGGHNYANTATEHSVCMWRGFDIQGTPSTLGASFAGGRTTRAAAIFLAEPGLVKTALQAVAMGKKAAFAPTVSKIIHQTWKSRVLPPHLAALTMRWKALHPDWTYKLWTDEECATAKAVEGLQLQDGVHVRIAETTAEFVSAIYNLCMDSVLYECQRDTAEQYVMTHFGPQVVRASVHEALQRALRY